MAIGKLYDPNINVRDSQGRLTLSRIKSSIKARLISIGITPTPLPLVPLMDRVYMTVQNIGNAPVYLGGSDVTASGSNQGYNLLPFSDRNYQIDDTAVVYGIVASGTQSVICEEGI